ncbi:MAG: hypothetical protein KKB51_15615 [Candidatus Riflebacteria bacterium]|nr:hypothetical protein [Candidatus Riflebacteria bacterium]
MNRFTRKRRGVAIVVAVFFAFCMLVLFVAMMFRQSSTAHHNQLTIDERQAFFAARAAMQHFLLKAKLFPTELYDAVELAQGKNPLCNFAEFEGSTDSGQPCFEPVSARPELFVRVRPDREVDMNQQPKYFYQPLPGKDAFIRLGSYHNPDYRYLAPGLARSEPEYRYVKPNPPPASAQSGKYLNYYIRDCSNMLMDGARMQVPLEIVISPDVKNIQEWDAATMDGYPYTMSYKVTDVKIQSIKGLRKYGEEAIEVSVEGAVKNFQGKLIPQTQKRVQKITRKGAID